HRARSVPLDLHALHTVQAVDTQEPRPGQDGDAEQRSRGEVQWTPRDDPIPFLDHGEDMNSRMARREDGGEGNELRSDDDRAAERPHCADVDHVLKRAGRRYPPRPGAGDEARRPGSLAYPRCDEDRARLDRPEPGLRRDFDPSLRLEI